MSINLVVLDHAHDILWDDLIKSSPQGCVFMQSSLLQMLIDTSNDGLCIERIGILGKDNKLVAGWAIPYHLKSGIGLRFSYGFGLRFSGPILNIDPHRHIQRNQALALLSEYVSERYDVIVTECHPGLQDAREFIYHGWTVIPEYYHIWDLNNLAETFSKFESEKRREVRRGLEAYQYSQETIDADSFAQFVALYQVTMQQRHEIHHDTAWVNVLQQRLLKMQASGICQLYVVKSEEQYIAALTVIVSAEDQTAYYWMVGSDQNHRDSRVVPSLYWFAAKNLREADSRIRFVNLGTSPISSLSRFKDLLGATPVLSFRLIYKNESWKANLWHIASRMKSLARSAF